MAAAIDPQSNENVWMDFCERHATAAAQDFSKSCIQFISVNLSESARANISYKDFLKKFTECFTEQFEIDFCKRRSHKLVNGTTRHSDDLNDCISENGDISPKLNHKPFFRR